MVKRCIGIDISSFYVCAVQITRTGERFHIEKVFNTQMRRSTDSPSEILRTLIGQHGFDRRAAIAISMPNDSVFFRNLEADSASLEQIRAYGSTTLEHNFPVQPDEAVAGICSYHQLSGEKYSVLLAAAKKESLRERLNTLTETRMHPELVDTAIFAVHSTITANHPEIITGRAVIIYVDESCLLLAITQNNNILIVRNIPIVLNCGNDADSVQEQGAEALSDEVEMTWHKVFKGKNERDGKIYLAAADNVPNNLKAAIEEKLCCQITVVNPHAKIKCPPEYNPDAAICVAEGLAIRALAPDKTTGINFLNAYNADAKPKLDLKREFITCAALAVAIAVVSLAGLFLRLSHLETKYAQIKDEMREILQHTLPEEKNIVNPLAQLEQKLQLSQKDYALLGLIPGAGVEPLDVLYAITTSIPPEVDINIDNMLITTESVRLTGISQSFESVYNWQRLLQETLQFSTVAVKDIRKEPDSGLVHFTISMSLATLEQDAVPPKFAKYE